MALALAGKAAIITGAGSGLCPSLRLIKSQHSLNVPGINLAFARLLLSSQCNVIIADLALRPEAEELIAKHASSSEGAAKAVFQKTDVRNWAELEEMFNLADRLYGGADIVCPGAGVFEPVRVLVEDLQIQFLIGD